MDRISRHSQEKENVWFGGLKTASLLLAVNMVLLASSDCDLQQELGCSAAKCQAAQMRVSTFKSDAMVLCQKIVDCSLQLLTFQPQVN